MDVSISDVAGLLTLLLAVAKALEELVSLVMRALQAHANLVK